MVPNRFFPLHLLETVLPSEKRTTFEPLRHRAAQAEEYDRAAASCHVEADTTSQVDLCDNMQNPEGADRHRERSGPFSHHDILEEARVEVPVALRHDIETLRRASDEGNTQGDAADAVRTNIHDDFVVEAVAHAEGILDRKD